MHSEKENIYRLLCSGKENNKLALTILKGNQELKAVVEAEALPVLAIAKRKTLKSLPKFIALFDPENSTKNWRDALSACDNLSKKIIQEGLLASLFKILWVVPSRITRLYLEYAQLETLPNLAPFTALDTLNVSSNQLRAIPTYIGKLEQLSIVVFDDNQLKALPDSLGALKNLQGLYASKNQLTTLPSSIGQLTTLWKCFLANNSLTTLPTSFKTLESLKILDLDNNQFTEFPEVLATLPSLERLSLRGNPLSEAQVASGRALLPNCTIKF